MNIVLWLVQIVLGAAFAAHVPVMFAPPPNLPPNIQWVYDLSPPLRIFIGVCELLAAIGLILPGLTKIRPGLTPLAALGLMLIMALAAVFHTQRGEPIIGNVVLFILAAFVAYGRWRVSPLRGRVQIRPAGA